MIASVPSVAINFRAASSDEDKLSEVSRIFIPPTLKYGIQNRDEWPFLNLLKEIYSDFKVILN